MILQTVLGIDAVRIARAFRVPSATMSQRLVRAKVRIRDAGLAFALSEPAELAPRLDAVLEAIYANSGLGGMDWTLPPTSKRFREKQFASRGGLSSSCQKNPSHRDFPVKCPFLGAHRIFRHLFKAATTSAHMELGSRRAVLSPLPLDLHCRTRISRNALPYVLVLLILLSAGLAQWGASYRPEVNFFLSFSRFWELLAGAAIACLPAIHPKPWHKWPALLGLGLISVSYIVFSEATATPSLLTFVPVTGAALVLMFGAQPGLAKTLLTLPLVVGLGVISYSVYLWHQPVFAFARLYYVIEVPQATMLALIGIVLGLSWLSWRYVEQPFRGNTHTKRKVFAATGAGIVAYLVTGILLSEIDLSRYRYSAEALQLLNYDDTYREATLTTADGQYLTRCFDDGSSNPRPDLIKCMDPQQGAPIIWGDSHAQALASGFLRLNLRPGLAAAAGCPPLIATGLAEDGGYCQVLNENVLSRLLQARQGTFLVLHANWNLVLESETFEISTSDELIEQLSATLKAVRDVRPDIEVLIVASVPQWGEGLPVYLYRLGLGLDAVIISRYLRRIAYWT